MMREIDKEYYKEPFRPQFHFSPKEKWMNDPNGMVYHNGIYHLFYQYYPKDIIWGPMHWGHATSIDLIYWQHKPIALFPDEHGYIFSGSAVLDISNTSGFGSLETPPLVVIYTYHNVKGKDAGRSDYETQGIAYSLDNGETWTVHKDNPVIGNDGVKDFRDPKVFWDTTNHQWVMCLVAGDHLQLWVSKDLKKWVRTSVFGKDKGAHSGVWECPDLFKLPLENSKEEKWILFISINPGAPNGGSGTQYFIGDFDGSTFTTDQEKNKWVDWGTDNYAGVTYSNAPNDEKIFMGWMSNWDYGQETPTKRWRGAMTVPRKLTLKKIGVNYELLNYPVENLKEIMIPELKKEITIAVNNSISIPFIDYSQSEIKFDIDTKDFELVFTNDLKEELKLKMDGNDEQFLLDRTGSGKTNFHKDFGDTIQKMPVGNLNLDKFEVRILLDASSLELFINKGQYTMTAQVFPNQPYNFLVISNNSDKTINVNTFEVNKIKSIW